jgi:dienelactone hydrolase
MSCPDCFQGGKATGEAKGYMKEIAGVQTYVAGDPSTTTSQSTIIYFTDAFGLPLINNKLLADEYASATGFRVLVPDIIPGGPMSLSVMALMEEIRVPVSLFNLWGQVSRVLKIIKGLWYYIPFKLRAAPNKKTSFQPCLEYARKVRAGLPAGAKLGAAGFCWGGYQSLKLCTYTAAEEGSERLLDAQFCAHPSGLKMPGDVVDAVTKFKVPVAIAHAQKDFAIPTEKVEEAERALQQEVVAMGEERGLNYQIITYDGVGHGFAVRPKTGNKKEAEAAAEAKGQAVQWFKRWL